jgi:hypothetical protein
MELFSTNYNNRESIIIGIKIKNLKRSAVLVLIVCFLIIFTGFTTSCQLLPSSINEDEKIDVINDEPAETTAEETAPKAETINTEDTIATVTTTTEDTTINEPVSNLILPTEYLLLSDMDMLEISGSEVNLYGNIHSNTEIKIGGERVNVYGNKTTSPKINLPDMTDYVPSTSSATIIIDSDEDLNGFTCDSAEGCIVWVKGKLEISGKISGKVWFLVEKEVTIEDYLTPADSSSSIRIYSKKDVEISDSNVNAKGLFWQKRTSSYPVVTRCLLVFSGPRRW